MTEPGKRRHLEVPWDTMVDHSPKETTALLARFRRKHPYITTKNLSAREMAWGYTWVENRVLLDLRQSASERAEARYQQLNVSFFCRHGTTEEHSRHPLDYPPDAVTDLIEEEEYDRGAEVDWGHQGPPEPEESLGELFAQVAERHNSMPPAVIEQIARQLDQASEGEIAALKDEFGPFLDK